MHKKVCQIAATLVVILSGACLLMGQAKPAIVWNELAASRILKPEYVRKLGSGYEAWKWRQITWPAEEDVQAKRVEVSEPVKDECLRWLKRFVKPEKLPSEIADSLLPLRRWGVVGPSDPASGACDVFVVRYYDGRYVVHMQESPYNVVLAISDEATTDKPRLDREAFVLEVAAGFLMAALQPDGPDAVRVFQIPDRKEGLTRVIWATQHVETSSPEGQRAATLDQAQKNGAIRVRAETDGRFVRFDIVKCLPGPHADADPYEKRFGD